VKEASKMKIGLKQTVTCLGLILALASASAAAGQDESAQKEGRAGKMANKIVSELNLTPEQSEEIKGQRSEHRRIKKELGQSLREKQKELKAELEKEVSDRKELERISKDIKRLQGERVDHRIEGVLQMKEILTPEQYRKFHQRTRPQGRKRGRRMNHKGRNRRFK
jgi:Spy/CpxP family protein refolding chaperone